MTLAEYITANLDRPFAWGSMDCVHFAAGWLVHATGRDYLADLPKWASAKEAHRLIKKLGGLEKAVDERLARIDPRFATDGDLALYDGCLCIFSGPHVVGPGGERLEFIDRMEVQAAWSYK